MLAFILYLGIYAQDFEQFAFKRSACSPVWGQCGGASWTGATCCAAGSHCSAGSPPNKWFSQCLPGSGNTQKTTVPKPTTPSSTPSTGCGALFAQCGGQGFTGKKCCQSGLKCNYSSQWFSQCIQASNAPGTGTGSNNPQVTAKPPVASTVPVSPPVNNPSPFNYPTAKTNLRPGGSCGSGTACIYGECCSAFGNCGNSAMYCGSGCQASLSPNGCQVSIPPLYGPDTEAACIRPASSISFTGGKMYSTMTNYDPSPGSACPPYTRFSPLGTPIVALSLDIYAHMNVCYKKIQISVVPNGPSVIATVVDKCVGCIGIENIDANDQVWESLGLLDRKLEIGGVCYVEWHFV
ncbi:hypothetical protein HDV01_005527 [Terramyces sp. JEL0728]|nr:hypothetical protein HDV01_005527 [Terramyces sp. JEL0728]